MNYVKYLLVLALILNAIEILVSKALIDSYIIDYEFVSVNMFSHS